MVSIWEEYTRLIFHVNVELQPSQVEEQFGAPEAPGDVELSGGSEADQPSALREAALAGTGSAEAAAAAALDPATASPTRSAAGSPGGNSETVVTPEAEKIGRNDPCWCGSGKKYKKCHGA